MSEKAFRKITLFLILFYQVSISRWTKPTCRFYPTCSNYAKEAVSSYGVIKGLYLTLLRLLRCHPFHPGGVDPVPLKKK